MPSSLSDALSSTTEMKSNKVKVDCMYTNSLMNRKLKYVFVMIFFLYNHRHKIDTMQTVSRAGGCSSKVEPFLGSILSEEKNSSLLPMTSNVVIVHRKAQQHLS